MMKLTVLFILGLGTITYGMGQNSLKKDVQDLRILIESLPDQGDLDNVHDRLNDAEVVADAVSIAPEAEKQPVVVKTAVSLLPAPYAQFGAVGLGVWGALERRKRLKNESST